MSEELLHYVNSFYKQICIMQIFINKKKKNIFKIKEGIMNLIVTMKADNITCTWCHNPKQCSLKKCKHIYFVLMKHFDLSLDEICLLFRNDSWGKFFKDNTDLPKSYQDEDCGICLEEIEQNNYINFKKIYQCLDCGNFSHNKCLKQINKDHCIFCYKDNNPNLPF